jgi:hypothetical protein
MLTIDRLRLSLPSGYESRAERIARLVADELASIPMPGDAWIERVSIPSVKVTQGASDRHVAGSIAGAIASHLNRSGGGGEP